MENNREIIEYKQKSLEEKLQEKYEVIDKFAFNVSNINKIIAIMLVFFIFMCFVYGVKKNDKLNYENNVYENMITTLRSKQLYDMYLNLDQDEGQTENIKINENPIFNNAKEAVIFAYNRLVNYKSYDIDGSGVTNAEAVGQQVEVKINYRNVKFLDGVQMDENVRYETQTSFGQTEAAQYAYKNGQRYRRFGSNIRYSNGRYIADFNGSFSQYNSVVKSHPFYIINESTVTYEKMFSFTRKSNGRIAYYKATVFLDTSASVANYAKDIQEQGGTSYPSFSSVELSCIIDPNGDLMSYTATEKMTLSKTIVVDITTTTTTVTTSVLLSHDVEPSVPKPNIW